jgi:hypothetical protein
VFGQTKRELTQAAGDEFEIGRVLVRKLCEIMKIKQKFGEK